MKVILVRDIPGLGREGELKTVSDGYARNYLLPKKLAVLATPQELKKWTLRRQQQEKQNAEARQQAERLKEKIESLRFEKTLSAQGGKAFGSVRKDDILDFLEAQGISVAKDAVYLDQPIKKAGQYAVPIALHPQVSATLKITVQLSQQP